MKYRIKIRGIGIKPAIIEVEGEPVRYLKMDYIKLFVHQMPGITFSLCGEINVQHGRWNGWHVAEEKTGLMVGHGKTKSGAIRHAYKAIQYYTEDKVLEIIKKYKAEL